VKFEPDPPAQNTEHRFGDELPVLLAEVRMRAEKAVQLCVGRLGHWQNSRERRLRRGQQLQRGIGLHGVFFGVGLAGCGGQKVA
jgi:hypothetical protein